MNLLAIDSGFRYFGWAVFEDGLLKGADLGRNATGEPPNFLSLVDVLRSYSWRDAVAVIEFPHFRSSTPNVDSLLKLAAGCGAYTALLQASRFSVEWVKPSSWKGSVPKAIMCRRIVDKLSEEEYSMINKPLDHNVLDAVGVGLWKAQRL